MVIDSDKHYVLCLYSAWHPICLVEETGMFVCCLQLFLLAPVRPGPDLGHCQVLWCSAQLSLDTLIYFCMNCEDATNCLHLKPNISSHKNVAMQNVYLQ